MCELLTTVIDPEEGVVETPKLYSQSVRSIGDNLGTATSI
jgi:hypothetical protein